MKEPELSANPDAYLLGVNMKPAIVLYKTLPADLRQKLDEHFSVTAFDELSHQTFPAFYRR